MKRRNLIITSLTLCLIGAAACEGLARNSIASNWRTFYPGACQTLQDATTNAQNCVLCHTTGFNLNSYAQDLLDNNLDFGLVDSMDSDGDGRTNGEEILLDCTFPGDAISPVDVDSWGSIKVLFR